MIVVWSSIDTYAMDNPGILVGHKVRASERDSTMEKGHVRTFDDVQ